METSEIKQNKKLSPKQLIIVFIGMATLVFLGITYDASFEIISLEDQVLPKEGVVLPIEWKDTGAQMVQAGVIDAPRFETIYAERGGLSEESRQILYDKSNKKIVMTKENSGVLLNMFWAFGLSNKNEILETGLMVDERTGGDPGRFASTGGWSLAVGGPMKHYSKHSFVPLTNEQQKKVEDTAKGIYRPCCGNSTHFPDCNHGMAMLGLLELMAHSNVSEEKMYETALMVNSYWFPETYMTLATYFEKNSISWDAVDPRIVLSADFSSGNGYQRILREINPIGTQGGGGCSV